MLSKATCKIILSIFIHVFVYKAWKRLEGNTSRLSVDSEIKGDFDFLYTSLNLINPLKCAFVTLLLY